MLAECSLWRTRVGDSVPLDDGASGSAFSDTKNLRFPAIALLIHSGATGNLTIVEPDGRTRVIDVSKWAAGVWHLITIKGIKSTGTTATDTKIELGWARY